ncbi:50S ribosomal protein L9 [Gracilinema caldarium]|uniref:50S ribosomal protein L9 n=1 Tax=Gracilinema caldarium TaxID=215591 RepID=UPI0026EA24A4|nr:50S ribosomal protein L9 [Gracilinema caldarium]
MKVILNKDVNPLGEEGDVKDVAKGYARNYLFPRGLAVPYTERNMKVFEARREEIEARKAEKRKDAASLKERLEGTELVITMPAGANGKLYGAVTNQTIADELIKQGFQVERKRIEVPGNHIKSVGKFKIHVKLYESTTAEVTVVIQAQVTKTEEKPEAHKGHQRGHRGAHKEEAAAETSAQENASDAAEARE